MQEPSLHWNSAALHRVTEENRDGNSEELVRLHFFLVNYTKKDCVFLLSHNLAIYFKQSHTVAWQLVWTISTVIGAVAPGAVFDTAPVDTAPVALLTHAVHCNQKKREINNWLILQLQIRKCLLKLQTSEQSRSVMLTAVGLLLIRLVFAVSLTVTGQAVVDTVTVSTLKLIHAVTGCVFRWEKEITFILYYTTLLTGN